MTETLSPSPARSDSSADSPRAAGAIPLKPGRWPIDAGHFSVGFRIGHLGVSKVRGRFGDVDAELVVGESLADTAVTATVGMASLDTGNGDRDAHMMTGDFLDPERRPNLSFRSVAIDGDGTDWTMDGELTIGEVTRPVRFDVDFGGLAPFYDGSVHAGFGAKGEISRKDFGISFGQADGMLGDVVEVELDLEFLQPA